jgi:integrase
MAYQRGSLKQVPRKDGDIWMLRYRVATADGRRVEHGLPVGFVRDFPSEGAAWREVDRLGLLVRVNSDAPCPGRIRFNQLAEHYLKADFGEDAVRPKSVNTIPIVEHYVRDYLIARWGNEIAEDIKPLDIQRWVKSLHSATGLAWTTISKIRGIMLRVYKVGILHEVVTKNPVLPVETRCTTHYKAVILTPDQTLAILNRLTSPLHFALVLTCAATALRASEVLALRWSDVRWDEARIRISKRWARGMDGDTKTKASDAYVPLHPELAGHLLAWRSQSLHAKETDFVFPSLRENGRVPLSPRSFVCDHLRTAAIEAGVRIEKGQRFGLHNLRHSLSNWLVNKAKVDPKTVQSMLRHAKIQTTLDLYTQGDGDETRIAQGRYLEALGMASQLVQ